MLVYCARYALTGHDAVLFVVCTSWVRTKRARRPPIQDWTLRKGEVPRGSESAEAMLELSAHAMTRSDSSESQHDSNRVLAVPQLQDLPDRATYIQAQRPPRSESAHDPLQTRRIQQSSPTIFKSSSPRKPSSDLSTGRGGSAERAVQARNLRSTQDHPAHQAVPSSNSQPNASVQPLISLRHLRARARRRRRRRPAARPRRGSERVLEAAPDPDPCANPPSAAAAPARERRSQRIRALPRPITRSALRAPEHTSAERRALRTERRLPALRIQAPAPLSPPRASPDPRDARRPGCSAHVCGARRAPFAHSTPLRPARAIW
ncbi:hypothetical protein B0H15DRAFT_946217 [Mycena belliarum]|uniref:Uncharacterized protein n=1 Tax=Mycena belliarum TaxID=1033014 RepID=A0AAD6XSP9_9AGAR|nr:hypothetical protein B0H15DRAFT_946217 [Mycena belliae]